MAFTPETKSSSQYVISGGQSGKDRLNLLSRALLPTTFQLFSTVGLGAGMKCLDLGCGGGHVTMLMAGIVGPQGKIVGIDGDAEILRLVQQDIDSENINNIELRQADATSNQGTGEYDLVYARFLLTHLTEPEKCLGSMLRACKSGGFIVIEDIDFTGCFCHPPLTAYEKYSELYQQVVMRRGADPNIGQRLPGMLRKAGVDGVNVNVVQPAHFDGECKFVAAITMERIRDSVVAEGLASKAEVDDIVDGLNNAAADPDIMMSFPRIFQTWGRTQ